MQFILDGGFSFRHPVYRVNRREWHQITPGGRGALVDSLAFLERPARGQPQPVYVLSGDEDFLKRQVLNALKAWVLGPEEGFGFSTYPGDKADYSNVRDELATLPFLA